jgi:hypothetical protein
MLAKAKLEWVISVQATLIMSIAAYFLGGGIDLKLFYVKFAAGCLRECNAYYPHFAQWFVYPLQFIPHSLLWPTWSIVSFSLILAVLWARDNRPVIIFAFPVISAFWYGQLDAIVLIGLALLLEPSLSPHIRGFGLLMSLIKPHVSLFIIAHALISDKQPMKLLIVPIIGLSFSLAQYGLNWPLIWLNDALKGSPMDSFRLASATYPLALVLLPLIGLSQDKTRAVLIFSPLALPNVSFYDYMVSLSLLKLANPWAIIGLSWGWLLAMPFMWHDTMRVAPLLPILLLYGQLYQENSVSLTRRVVTPQF